MDFNGTVVIEKPDKLLWPVTRDKKNQKANEKVKQIHLWEKACEPVTAAFAFAADWLGIQRQTS